MEFIALPVAKGDSFLLRDGDFSLLVDGGDGKYKIIDEIKKYTNLLDVVICTHYDEDHIVGLLDLFQQLRDSLAHDKDPGFIIKQIWLPDIFQRITLYKREYLEGIIALKNEKEMYMKMKKNGEASEELLKRSKKEGIDTVINNIIWLVDLCKELEMSSRMKIRIQWLSFSNSIVNERILDDIEIYGINCTKIERKIEPYGPEADIYYYLSQINRESLVFRYNEAGFEKKLPNVLFTADSSFEFCIEKKSHSAGKVINYVPLNDGVSVVTAPHHGSPEPLHENVYQNLEGKDFIFVRSSERHKSRPCKFYKDHPENKRYCTRCRTTSYEQPVNLEFRGGQWIAGKDVKGCKCVKPRLEIPEN
ncbi:MBL fold metallo-hydrolase [Bacillus cereus]|nr:MBL fold metallo-hydrolase [Bacillus cereus]